MWDFRFLFRLLGQSRCGWAEVFNHFLQIETLLPWKSPVWGRFIELPRQDAPGPETETSRGRIWGSGNSQEDPKTLRLMKAMEENFIESGEFST